MEPSGDRLPVNNCLGTIKNLNEVRSGSVGYPLQPPVASSVAMCWNNPTEI